MSLKLEQNLLKFTVYEQTNASAEIIKFFNNFIFEGPEDIPKAKKIENYDVLKAIEKILFLL